MLCVENRVKVDSRGALDGNLHEWKAANLTRPTLHPLAYDAQALTHKRDPNNMQHLCFRFLSKLKLLSVINLIISTFIFIQALDKCRSEVRKLQKKTQKASNEKYLEREQKSTEELGQLQRALLAFRSHGLRKVIIQQGDNMKGVQEHCPGTCKCNDLYCPGFSSALVIYMLYWCLLKD